MHRTTNRWQRLIHPLKRIQRFARKPLREKLVALRARSWHLQKLGTPFIPYSGCRAGCLLRDAGERLTSYERTRRVWIDVGAHLGEMTFAPARLDPSLTVFAFEPNLAVAVKRVGLIANFVVLPMAVGEEDGCRPFYVNQHDAASSLLPFDQEGLRNWIGGEQLNVERTVSVSAIRLDTFMELMRIPRIAFLKIDAQGADLAVVRSAGSRLEDIDSITLEVAITPVQLYTGATSKELVVGFLQERDFELVRTVRQSFDQEENLTFVRKPLRDVLVPGRDIP